MDGVTDINGINPVSHSPEGLYSDNLFQVHKTIDNPRDS